MSDPEIITLTFPVDSCGAISSPSMVPDNNNTIDTRWTHAQQPSPEDIDTRKVDNNFLEAFFEYFIGSNNTGQTFLTSQFLLQYRVGGF